MLKTLVKVLDLFKENRIDYCVIGGLAMLLHQGRANTVDIDFYVLVNDLKDVVKVFRDHQHEVKSAGEHQLKAMVDGVPIDILYADHYIGADVVKRAAEKKLGGHFVRVATPEDLIILKTLANRSVDRRDIEELREVYGKLLDEKYIERKLKKIKQRLGS